MQPETLPLFAPKRIAAGRAELRQASPYDVALTKLTQEQIDRFWTNVRVGDADACWPWLRSLATWGYGKTAFFVDGKQWQYNASRVALYLSTRTLAPIARHKCDTPICCNPHHLEWGTQRENVLDCLIKGRRSKEPPVRKLTDDQAEQIRARYAPRRGAALAREYGVSIAIVNRIARGDSYRTKRSPELAGKVATRDTAGDPARRAR